MLFTKPHAQKGAVHKIARPEKKSGDFRPPRNGRAGWWEPKKKPSLMSKSGCFHQKIAHSKTMMGGAILLKVLLFGVCRSMGVSCTGSCTEQYKLISWALLRPCVATSPHVITTFSAARKPCRARPASVKSSRARPASVKLPYIHTGKTCAWDLFMIQVRRFYC